MDTDGFGEPLISHWSTLLAIWTNTELTEDAGLFMTLYSSP